MTRAVYITGIGLATPLGGTPEQTWRQLLEGQFINDHSRVTELSSGAGLRVDQLAIHVARQALLNSNWDLEKTKEAALVVGTSRGPIEGWIAESPFSLSPVRGGEGRGEGPLAAMKSAYLGAPRKPLTLTLSPEYKGEGRNHASLGWGMSLVAGGLARKLNLGGPLLTFSAACASSLHALIRAALMLYSGEADRALVVGADASLHPMFLQSFRRLGVLAPQGFGCRPFDEERSGFIASEAATAVCLEVLDEQGAAANSFIRLDRFAMAGDAIHLTGHDPSGKTLTNLLSRVIDSRPIDLIHAHGTGTHLNDPIELAACEAAIASGDSTPHLYSHKGALGHSLGASGLVAVVLNCLAHRHGIIPPNIRTQRPLPTQRLRLERNVVTRPVRRSLVCAAGFGGAMAAITLA